MAKVNQVFYILETKHKGKWHEVKPRTKKVFTTTSKITEYINGFKRNKQFFEDALAGKTEKSYCAYDKLQDQNRRYIGHLKDCLHDNQKGIEEGGRCMEDYYTEEIKRHEAMMDDHAALLRRFVATTRAPEDWRVTKITTGIIKEEIIDV